MQERFADAGEIKRLNDYLESCPEIVSILPGIQTALCGEIKVYLEHNPILKESSVTFFEIGFYDNINSYFIPNSRFLKVVIINLGRYFSKERSPEENLIFAAKQSELDAVYLQQICMFNKISDTDIQLSVIEGKVCPARGFVAKAINHYLK